MLVIQTVGVPHPGRSPRRRRKAKAVEAPAERETVPVTRATVARSEPLEGEREAETWLKGIAADSERLNEEVKGALAVLNRALGVLRETVEDPSVADVGLGRALALRVGYGSGEQIADGIWASARELPPARDRTEDLDAHRKVAVELSGREPDEE